MSTPLPPDAPNTALDPALFGEPSARDERFRVVDRWAECVNLPEDHPAKLAEFLHRQMNEEIAVMENAARSLAEFTDADWEVRYWLARQCSDEARHVLNYRRAMERRGVRVGDYPVLSFQYRALGVVRTLIGRLAVQNRTFEADGLDAVTHAIEEAREMGDDDLVEMYDAQQADEILHIRFANEYIRRRAQQSPAELMQMARALRTATTAFQVVFDKGGTHVEKYGVAEELRAHAGFDEGEIRVAVEMSERRRAAVRAVTG